MSVLIYFVIVFDWDLVVRFLVELYDCDNGIEVVLIFNIIVLLCDGEISFKFELDMDCL